MALYPAWICKSEVRSEAMSISKAYAVRFEDIADRETGLRGCCMHAMKSSDRRAFKFSCGVWQGQGGRSSSSQG